MISTVIFPFPNRSSSRWYPLSREGTGILLLRTSIFSLVWNHTLHLCVSYYSWCNPTVLVRFYFTPQCVVRFKSSYSFVKHCLWTRQCTPMTSTTLVRTVMGSRSIHKNFLRPLFGLFSCPLCPTRSPCDGNGTRCWITQSELLKS